ncbi:MAG: hypothetical protein DI601_23370 [Azospirillum brasilense]|nr:MAG: hypothetical protein DI601_23370 [Azospirillum brasilense]
MRASREKATSALIHFSHRVEMAEHQGRNFAGEVRDHREAMAIQAAMPRNLAALDEALRQMRGGAVTPAEEHLRRLRVETEVARRDLGGVAKPSTPSPGMG